jgi:hypothetical protein
MCHWIRGYYAKDEEKTKKGIYTDIGTGWDVSKLEDFVKAFDLDKATYKMHANGWFTDKMNIILNNSPFGESAVRIFKTMDILIRRYDVKISECYVDLSRGLIVYTVNSSIDTKGQIVFEGIIEIQNE